MNPVFVILAVLLVGSVGITFIALNKYDTKKEFKKYNIMIGVLSIVVFVGLLSFISASTENKREHFKEGGFLRCTGRLDNYLVSNKEYILLDDYFIKDERILSIDYCERIE